MKQGVFLSVFSSALFALLYYYVTVLQPLGGDEVFAWRIILAMPALALVISRARVWPEVLGVGRRFCTDWRFAGLLVLSAALIGTQLWLFVWAPLHQKALDVSMGYFLLPLMMVLVGRVFYHERLSRMQTIAVAIAAVGVVHELISVGRFSWATALVVLGYPPYFMLRRKLKIGSFSTLWYDMALLVPAAIYILYSQEHTVLQVFQGMPRLLALLPIMGLISSVALVCYISASRMLPLGLFGILSYVEPILLFWVAFLLLNEPMTMQAWFTYIPIWIAVGLVAAEGFLAWRREAVLARSAKAKDSMLSPRDTARRERSGRKKTARR